MKFTRAIALCALTLAIALAIGAIAPYQPLASAGNSQPIFNSAPEHVEPTPALPTAAPVVEQLPAPTPQVIYIQLPAAPPPQVIYLQPAAPVEQQAVAPVEQQPAAQVEQLAVVKQVGAAPVVDQAANDYQQRRLDAINSGAAYRPRTR